VTKIGRRSFLKLAAAGILPAPTLQKMPVGRVAVKTVEVRTEPDPKAPAVLSLPKDTLIQILRTVEAGDPKGNPRWLATEEGYVHSGDIQPVEFRPQIPVGSLAQTTPAEVSVPIARSYRKIGPEETALYRLYYRSVHWVTGVRVTEDNQVWYILRDAQLQIDYFVPGEEMRLLPPDSYAPLDSDVDPGRKWIEIRLATQTLRAYVDREVALETTVSAGMGGKDMSTPTGIFHVQIKVAAVHMGNGRITSDPNAYELPGVPWVSYFEITEGVALHGAYWHNDFGRPRSHGCVNLRPDDALWLYRWMNPPAPEANIKGTGGYGTRVVIR
jgi:hypothetical protein